MYGNIIAMIVVGYVLLVIFFVCDIKLLSERFVVVISWIGERCVMPPQDRSLPPALEYPSSISTLCQTMARRRAA